MYFDVITTTNNQEENENLFVDATNYAMLEKKEKL